MTRSKRIYVLDTNVLMHDPTALFKFEEHDVYLPMQVMEELDNGKKGTSEASRNARQVSRFLNELIEAHGSADVHNGIALVRPNGLQLRGAESAGRLLFQTGDFDAGKRFGTVIPDNNILGAILALKESDPGAPVVFVSKDINLRIKASIAGIVSEDYENDRALDDFSLLYTGATALPEDFWSRHGKDLRSWTDKGRTYYEIARSEDDDWYPNQFLYLPGDDDAEMKVAKVTDSKVTLQIVDDFRHSQHAVWGILARNRAAFAAHPEYMGLLGGQRKSSKFCVSNPDLRALVAADAVAQLPEPATLLAVLEKHRPTRLAPQQESSVERWATEVKAMHELGAKPVAIFDRLRLEHKDFTGSLSAIKRMWRRLEAEHGPRAEAVAIPVETAPGQVAQVDFGDVGKLYDPASRVLRRAYVFVMVLGYSRHMFAQIVFDQSTETWIGTWKLKVSSPSTSAFFIN